MKGKAGRDHLPYSPPPLASASNTTLQERSDVVEPEGLRLKADPDRPGVAQAMITNFNPYLLP